MLVLTRKRGEVICLGNNVRITVLGVRGNRAKLGFNAPLDVDIRRGELQENDGFGRAVCHETEEARQQPMVDATSPGITDVVPFVAAAVRHDAQIALAACAGGIPTTAGERIERIIGTLLPQALDAGVPLRSMYIDGFVTSVTCDQPHAVNTVNALRLLKVATDTVPNTIVHLRDISDGAPAAVQKLLNRTYLVMLMGTGLDAVVMDPLDSEAQIFMRLIKEREGRTPLGRLLLRLHDVTAAEAEMAPGGVDTEDPRQAAIYKTIQILTNQEIYADSYLST